MTVQFSIYSDILAVCYNVAIVSKLFGQCYEICSLFVRIAFIQFYLIKSAITLNSPWRTEYDNESISLIDQFSFFGIVFITKTSP